MSFSHTVTLTHIQSGSVFDNWDQYEYELNMLQAGSGWTFALWRSTSRNSTWTNMLNTIKVGDTIVLAVDGAPQINGIIKCVHPQHSKQGAVMVVSGKDLAGQAQEWDADPRISLRNTTLDEVLRQLFAPLGIPVVIGADATVAREVQSNLRPSTRSAAHRPRRQRVDRSHIQPGEKIWQVAEKLCKRYGLMLWVGPDSAGQLAIIIDKPAYEQAAIYRFIHREVDGIATQDTNILSGGYQVQIRNTPTEVFVYGRSLRGDTASSRIGVSVVNNRFDQQFTRLPLPPQPRHFQSQRANDAAQSNQEGERIVSDSMVDHAIYECTTQAHGQLVSSPFRSSLGSTGNLRLFALNSTARVIDDVIGLDKDMFIHQIKGKRGREEGTTTSISMHNLNAIKLVPDPEVQDA